MIAVVPGEYSDKATKKYRTVKEEIFDNLSTVSCLGDESPHMQSDEEDVVFLTEIKTEVGTVRKRDKNNELATTDAKPVQLAKLTETVTYVPSPAREYSCRKCEKKFKTKLQLMLHKQIHKFGVVPHSVNLGAGSEELNASRSDTSPEPGTSQKAAAKKRTKKNLHGQEDECNQSDMLDDNAPMEDESFNMRSMIADNVDDSVVNQRSVWTADLESESSICDRSSDEEYSDDQHCSDSSIESAGIRNAVNAIAPSNTISHNTSAHRQRKLSKAREVEENRATVVNKKRSEIGKRGSKLTCSYCEKRFARIDSFKIHLMIHTGEKPHKCDICGKGFIERSKCVAHKITHTGYRPYKCTDCEKTFMRKSYLTHHRKIHTGNKQHCCQFCGKRFFKPSQVKYHTALHKGPKPYSCLICKKNVSTSDKWKRHVEKHHKDEYECIAAGKGEKKEPYKKTHKCGTCGKFFSFWSNLKRHELLHTGDRPHLCQFCDGSFTQSTTLKRHLLTHSGSKPYLCILCKTPFSDKDEMVSHRQTAHENLQSVKKTVNDSVAVDRAPSSTEMADNVVSDMNEDVCISERADSISEVQSSSRNRDTDICEKSTKKKKKRSHFPEIIEHEQDNSISQPPHVAHTSEGPEAINELQSSSARRESDTSQKSVERKKKIRLEIEKELDTSEWQTPRKKGRLHDEMFDYTFTETQDENQCFFNEVNEMSSAPQDDAYTFSMVEQVVDQLADDRHKIQFKQRSIEYIVEKNAKKHPETLYLVWSEDFSLDLAAAVAFNESNCILCVKNVDPSSLPDIWSLSRTFRLQTATVNFGSVAEPVHFFIFGEMNLSLGRRPFKSFKKMESIVKKFGRSEGKDVKNILRYSNKNNSWYSTILPQLKEDCIVANRPYGM